MLDVLDLAAEAPRLLAGLGDPALTTAAVLAARLILAAALVDRGSR